MKAAARWGDRRWPSPIQRLALEAAVGEREAATSAWRRLEAEGGLAELGDHEIARLLPLVWRNLGEAVGADADRLKGLYRRSWAHNQALLRLAESVVGRLHEEGIEALALKGVALSIAYYDDLGARPMGDVDLLVRPEQADRVFRIVESLGFVAIRPATASRWEREADDDWFHRHRHARGYRRGGSLDNVDIHWALLPDFIVSDPGVGDTVELWDHPRPLRLGEVDAATLSPTHHLLHAVVHGVRGGAMLRWIPDALVILQRAGGDIDWDRLVESAGRQRCTLMLREGLDYVVDEFDAPVPPAARRRLARAPVDRRQRALWWMRSRGPRGVLGSRFAKLCVTDTAALGPFRSAARVPRVLSDYLNLDRPSHLPLVLIHKIRTRRHRRSALR